MLQGIYISLHSAGNLFSGLRPRKFVLKIFQSPPHPAPPFSKKKMEWAILYPKYILLSLTLNSKLVQRLGRGIGCGYELWAILHYPLSWAIPECAKEKNGKLSRFNLKEKRILSESNWVNYCIKYLEQKAWKSLVYVYIMMENLN